MARLTTLKSSFDLLVPNVQLINSVRYVKSKISVKKYREPDYDKKLLLAACEPIKKRDTRPTWEKCRGPRVYKSVLECEPHPYDVIIGEELKAKLEPAKFILFYHRNNLLRDDAIMNKNTLVSAGFSYEDHNRMVYRVATENTKFSCLLPILTKVSSNMIAISNEINFKKFLEADKKLNNCFLLFAYVYDKLVSRVELMKLTRMPGLKEKQGEVLSTLSSPGSTLASSLNYQLSLLSNGLEARCKQLKGDNPTSKEKTDD